eukprot:CAMPEP_0184700316 /NCGR_PEP_ID=MMETSP0313-20130426/11873_1 /TAXON_ID=2792 /ORGANISM="Porphyridium aerugineum, Strain SAG 1380-2" /LENGTH=515 /DNA_ID=CAMNT_0027159917 /DNA_START=80 /DNA_END=1627 /DNA_ORIENTATION=-
MAPPMDDHGKDKKSDSMMEEDSPRPKKTGASRKPDGGDKSKGAKNNTADTNMLPDGDAAMEDSAVYKMDEEVIKVTDGWLDKCKSQEMLNTAIEELLSVERVQRLAQNAPETAYVCVAIVKLCRRFEQWKLLADQILQISKRRSQLKQATTKMVQEAFTYIDDTPDQATKVMLIETLREVCAGKIYVELEEARLTRMLAAIREKDGNLESAAAIMQDLQVETYGSMDRREKTDFILEQMRLVLLKHDFIRAAIIAKKITPRSILHDDMKDLRSRFHELMAEIHAYNGDLLEACRSVLARYETSYEQYKEEPEKWVVQLKEVILFLALAEHGPMQTDLLNRVSAYKSADSVPLLADFLKQLKTDELIRWTAFITKFKPELDTIYESFLSSLINKDEIRKKFQWESVLNERVTEHNLRILSKYYSRISLSRMAELLDLPVDVAEQRLASQISDKKALWAKIDRPKGIVVFRKTESPDATLNDWANSVGNLLELVEKTCHLVNKEIMLKQASEKLAVE